MEESCLHSYLYPEPPVEEGDVRQVRIIDKGSHPRCVQVLVEGIPTMGVMDSGADITIMGGDLLIEAGSSSSENWKKPTQEGG